MNRHYVFDDANRVTSVANTTDSGTQTFAYTHDGNGNILSENATSYGYDALNRLTSWEHDGVTTSYRYDDAGNLPEVANDTIPVKSFSYNAANQITNTGFSYDANGNMTSDGDKTYIYDGDNRLIEVKDGAITIAVYTYDYMGRRTSSTESGNTTYYHYDGSTALTTSGWNVVAETNSSGTTLATYVYDDKDQLVSMTRSENTYFYQYNAHGDVVSLTNGAGEVVNSYTYDPWGNITSSNEQVNNSYRYAGYRYDETTELYYLQTRYYNPCIARFLSIDTDLGDINIPITLNGYLYCNNNSTSMIDRDGHIPKDLAKRQAIFDVLSSEAANDISYKWAAALGADIYAKSMLGLIIEATAKIGTIGVSELRFIYHAYELASRGMTLKEVTQDYLTIKKIYDKSYRYWRNYPTKKYLLRCSLPGTSVGPQGPLMTGADF